MFSDHLRRIDVVSFKTLFGVAAGLVIVCQLIAMMLVVDGQVARANARDALRVSDQRAVVQCMESSLGVARHSCMLQVQALSSPAQKPATGQDPQALASAMPNDNAVRPAAPPFEGFMPASFATR
ncbi:hypothetical protein [Polaromonas sp.]|uniref:hypothetical protein n=1 Tax=Polaromonas sp. TaxID=1869339 RepID=UPI00286B310F|nr:hypothetical protein [Polaromonas sp.]